MPHDTALSSSDGSPLRIVIVGGGIAGLTAACALRGEGHEITVLEKSSLGRTIGGAISIPPQARRLLMKWGFDQRRARGMDSQGFEFRNAATGEVINHVTSDNAFEKTFGIGMGSYHRVDLYEEIRRLATSCDVGQGEPAELRIGVNIIDVDTANASVTLDTGEIVRGDVLIGADGTNSFMRSKVLGRPSEPHTKGITMFRTHLAREVIESDPELWKHFSAKPIYKHIAFTTKNRYMMAYWMREQETLSLGALIPVEFTKAEPFGWDGAGDPTELRELFKGCVEPIPNLLKLAETCGSWFLVDLEPLETWTNGRTIIIGDAAHPMYPNQASGGAMAVEDGEAIGAAFEHIRTSPDDPSIIHTILKQVERVRYGRVTRIQAICRSALTHHFELPPQDDLLEKVAGGKPMDAMAQSFDYRGAREWAREHKIEFPGV